MAFDFRKRAASLFTRGNNASVGVNDESNVAVGPVALREGDFRRNRILALDSTTSGGAGEWTATDTTIITLPFAAFNMPMLRRNGLYRWEIMGDYLNSASATTISAQLVVNATQTGSLFSWVQSIGDTTAGKFMLTLDLRVVGSLTAPTHIISAELTILNSSGVAVIGPPTTVTRLHQIYSLNSLTDQLLGWQVSKSVAGGANALSIFSVGCYELLSSSGV